MDFYTSDDSGREYADIASFGGRIVDPLWLSGLLTRPEWAHRETFKVVEKKKPPSLTWAAKLKGKKAVFQK
jgi:hypothetical protein